MRRFAIFLTALFASALLAGCYEIEQDFTINPDGSGKVAYTVILPEKELISFQGEQTPEERAKAALQKELEDSEGVDAWTDASWKLEKDGRITIGATAYFKDLSKLKLHTGGGSENAKNPVITKEKDGSLVVSIPLKKNQQEGENSEPGNAAPVSEEEIKARIRKTRNQYQMMKGMMTSMVGTMKVTTRLTLPGTLGEVSTFRKKGTNGISLQMEGKKLIEAMDAMMADDEMLAEAMKTKTAEEFMNGGPPDKLLMKKIYGSETPPRAVVKAPLKPLFDYEKEAKKAKDGFKAMVKKLDLEPTPEMIPPAKGEGFTSLEIEKVSLDRGPHGGYTFTLAGVLPGKILKVSGGMLEKAQADSGASLLPENDFYRKINWGRIDDKGSTVRWDVRLEVPGDDVTAIGEISGTLEYTTGGMPVETHLAFEKLAAGQKSEMYGAEIKEIKASEYQKGWQTLSLKVALPKDRVESVSFLDAAGNKLKVNSQGYMSSGQESTLDFSIKGTFPADARIVVSVHEDLQTYSVPFKVVNVDLLGRPRK